MIIHDLLLNLDATKGLKLSEDHIEFWEMARSYVIGGDSLQSSLIAKTIEQPVYILWLVGIVAIAATLMYQTGTRTAKDGPLASFVGASPHAFWVLLVVILLANQYANAYKVVNTSWAFRNQVRNNTQTATVAQVQITDAIANEIFNAQFGQSVSEQWATCQSLPFPTVRVPQATRPSATQVTLEEGQTHDFIDCMKTLQATVARNKAKLQQDCGANLQSCEIVQQKANDLDKQVSDGVTKIQRRIIGGPGSGTGFDDIGGLPDPLLVQEDFSAVGDAINAALSAVGDFAYMKLVELGNTLYTASIEILFLLGGLFFPITVVWSLIPGKRQVLLDWFVFLLSLIITEQVYLILIGTVAVLGIQPQFHAFGPRLFLITLGILGPLLAGAFGAGSGFAMARTYRGATIGAVGAALSVLSAGAFSIAYKINHNHQLRRA